MYGNATQGGIVEHGKGNRSFGKGGQGSRTGRSVRDRRQGIP
jgi:hypothetical protein